jgi:hypothetical protein
MLEANLDGFLLRNRTYSNERGHIWFAPRCKEKFVYDKKNIASIYPALG